MRFILPASLVLVAGLIPAVTSSISGLPEDLEGSGIDLESSGSGDWSDHVSPVEGKNIDEEPEGDHLGEVHKTMDSGRMKLPADTLMASSTRISASGFVFLENGRHFWEKEEVLAGMIAGVLTGAAIGATITAILIYKWKKREDEGGLLGKREIT
ncbi:uncharacterized protein LOC101171049 [Oryzias latipes]|uniref:uncharacterized protein LOC101171049 n=1 Tax=Oryzias latipes TaxID=8090 RepID=UPI000CE20779|nr:uncharacterized protein LOC101171049 [Oryzias latipes]